MSKSLPRTHWQTQFEIIEGNSNFHNEVRKIFATDPFFKRLKCYQEVPVKDLCPGYYSPNHRFDWYIENLGMVVELHGAQHYKFTNRGNKEYNIAHKDFLKSKVRDHDKQTAAEESELTYKVISYKEAGKLTAERLKELLLSGDTE